MFDEVLQLGDKLVQALLDCENSNQHHDQDYEAHDPDQPAESRDLFLNI